MLKLMKNMNINTSNRKNSNKTKLHKFIFNIIDVSFSPKTFYNIFMNLFLFSNTTVTYDLNLIPFIKNLISTQKNIFQFLNIIYTISYLIIINWNGSNTFGFYTSFYQSNLSSIRFFKINKYFLDICHMISTSRIYNPWT